MARRRPNPSDRPRDPYSLTVRDHDISPEESFEVELAEAEEPDEDGEEPQLDPEVAARRAAALARVRKFGDPVLRTRARPVDRFDEALAAEVEHMGRLMSDAMGVGLAATQVGVLHRVLVYRVGPHGPIAALVNPEIDWKGRETEAMEEGCLSLPGVLLDVDRPVHVRVRGRDERGDQLVVEASGLEARVIQHEIDHLDGVLILDRTSREARKEAMRALREAMQPSEAA
jgi:peptide deformylase